jgi:DNA ligase-1
VLTPSRKLQLLCDYLRHTTDSSRGWALAAITGDLDIPSVKPAAIRELVASRVDPVLFNLSYDFVGDLAETISLIWPQRPGANRAPDLNEIVETLLESTKAHGLRLVEGWLDALDATGRWGLLKLSTGGLRVGVSARLARQAVADFGKVDVAEIEELWHGMSPPYLDLFAWLEGKGSKPVSGALAPFRPLLAHPLLSKAERMEANDLDPSLIHRATSPPNGNGTASASSSRRTKACAAFTLAMVTTSRKPSPIFSKQQTSTLRSTVNS